MSGAVAPPAPWQPVGLVDPGDETDAGGDAEAGAGLNAEVPAGAMSGVLGQIGATSRSILSGTVHGMERMGAAGLDSMAATGDGSPFAPYQIPGQPSAGIYEPGAGEPMVAPEEANAEGKPVGLSKFAAPVPRGVLDDMVAEAQDAQKRAEVRAHIPAGWASGVNDVASFAAQMLDPVNIAAAFIPIGGEGIIAGGLARVGIEGATESLAGRTAVRAAAGALTGAAGQVPLTALTALADENNGQDMTAAGALTQVLSGAAFGGILHPLAGAAGDAWHAAFGASPAGRLVADDPTIRRDAASAAIAATAEDRPVQVHDFIDLSAQQQTQDAAIIRTSSTPQASGLRDELLGSTSLDDLGARQASMSALQDQIRSSATVQRALGAGDPEAVAASRAATTVAAAHKPPGPIPVAPTDLPEIEQMVRGMQERGHLGSGGEAEMARIDLDGENYESFAKAVENLGSCMGSAV